LVIIYLQPGHGTVLLNTPLPTVINPAPAPPPPIVQQPLAQSPLGVASQAQAVNQITGYPKPGTLGTPISAPAPQPQRPAPQIAPSGTLPPQRPAPLYSSPQTGNRSPFIVEELPS
jgi:hypothetical protein